MRVSAQLINVRTWRKADSPTTLTDVCYDLKTDIANTGEGFRGL
jgi:hypothetical protein